MYNIRYTLLQMWNLRDLRPCGRNHGRIVPSIFLDQRAYRCTRVQRIWPGRVAEIHSEIWPNALTKDQSGSERRFNPSPTFHDLPPRFHRLFVAFVWSHTADRKGRTTEFRRGYPNCNNEGKVGCGGCISARARLHKVRGSVIRSKGLAVELVGELEASLYVRLPRT